MPAGFEQLLVWQKAHALMLFIHREIAPRLPPEEKWDLAIQMRKSSKSVGANISEGHGRYYYQDRIRFCHFARGSLSETENHLIVARDLEYIAVPLYQKGQELAAEVHRLLNGYIAHLKRDKPGNDEQGQDASTRSD